MNPLENEFPLDNINEIIIDNGIVNIIYNDGNTALVPFIISLLTNLS